MKKIRILALGSILVLSFATGALAQTEESRTDSDQPSTAQSEEKAAPPTEQQTTTESEQKATPSPETTPDAE
jgi:cell division septation protein DedD